MNDYEVYPDEPKTGAILTNHQIKRLLDDHSIGHLTTDEGQIMMLDQYTHEGELIEYWVQAKKTYGELISWLGY